MEVTIMRKGQGSLEYLLILAAILAVAVVVVVVANSMLSAPQQQTEVQQEKYAAAMAGFELIGYDQMFAGTLETAPESVIYEEITYQKDDRILYTSQLPAPTPMFTLNNLPFVKFEDDGHISFGLQISTSKTASIFSNGMKSPAFGSQSGGEGGGPSGYRYIMYYAST